MRGLPGCGCRRRDPQRLRRYFSACALNTAGVVAHNTLFEAGIDRKTGDAYDRLPRNLYVLDSVPPWSSNRAEAVGPVAETVPGRLRAGGRRVAAGRGRVHA